MMQWMTEAMPERSIVVVAAALVAGLAIAPCAVVDGAQSMARTRTLVRYGDVAIDTCAATIRSAG